MRVFVHSGKGAGLQNIQREFSQVPAVGEFVGINDQEPGMFRVDFVIHCADKTKKGLDFDAEIWISPIDFAKALREGGAI